MKEQRNGLTTYEIDKLYEEESNGNWRLYIGKVAIINYDATSKHQLRYTHQDRLGSSLTYTDPNGQVTDRRMFDAFGKPRATDGNNLAVPKLQNPLLSRNGFTDHRHLDEVELIHMNGRAYDYNLGRFLSVDPVIQSPGNSQSLNPYSYIMNNPLAGTDPTGYACEAAIGSRICNSSVSASMTLENKTLKVHLSGGTEKQQLAAASAIVNGIQSQLAAANTLSNSGKAVDIGGQGNISSGNADAGGDEGTLLSGNTPRNENAAFNIGETVYSNDGESAEDFLERIAPRWNEITNEEKAEISSYLYQNDESGIYAVVPYSSGLPQLSLNKEVEIENFRNTGKTVHSHGPKVTWNERLEKKTLKFINKYASSRQEREALMDTYYRPFADKRSIMKLGGDRRQPSKQDKENSSGWLITDQSKVVPF